ELKIHVRGFNNSSSGLQSPLVSCAPKKTLTLPCRRDPSSAPYIFTCYQGHIASHNFALLIRSYYETIQIFLIPSEMLFALESDLLSNELKPLIELMAVVNEDSVCWTFTGLHLVSETIPDIARELLSDLLRLTLKMINVSDLCLLDQNKKSLRAIHGSEQEHAIGLIKDLHLWQTGAIFTEAITRDQETLVNLPPEADNDFASGELAKLKVQYDKLKNELLALSDTLARMTTK
ncbi:MAG: hypothetical protein JST89_19275, partial [Cyanobacteria bacterium SZAS-4]|nr:hypothetical protein [Cyanobacteria bacterium SZAS-4]